MDREVTHAQILGFAVASALATIVLCLFAAGAIPEKGFWSAEVAGWAATITTVGAVWVALTASDREHARTVKLRDEELERARLAMASRATALAVVFDHELCQASGELALALDKVVPSGIHDQPRASLKEIARNVPRDGLVHLSRFAGELDAFGVEGSTRLLVALSGWQMLTIPIKPEDYEEESDEDVAESVMSICTAFVILLDQLNEAREITMQWAAPVRGELAPLEVSQHWSQMLR